MLAVFWGLGILLLAFLSFFLSFFLAFIVFSAEVRVCIWLLLCFVSHCVFCSGEGTCFSLRGKWL